MSSLPSDNEVPSGLVESWRADTASPAELQRGYGRFLRTKERATPARLLGRWIVLGVLLGGGLAQGATLVAKRWEAANVRSVTVVSPPRLPASASARRAPTAPAPVVTLAPQPELPSVPEPHVVIPAVPVAAEAPADKLDAPSAATRAVSRRWQEAAAAMRAKDFVGADRALRELETTTHGSERDAVLLTRAQLLASSGRSAEALALARLVRAQSSSSMMRTKAGELEARLSTNRSSDRSGTPGAAMKQP